MSKNNPRPDNITQAVNLITAIMQRIMDKRLAKAPHKSLYTSNLKGAKT